MRKNIIIRLLTSMLMLTALPSAALAQTKLASDTITRQRTDTPTAQLRSDTDGLRNYGGFLLDMNSLMPTPTAVAPYATGSAGMTFDVKNLDALLRLKSNATYASGINATPSGSGTHIYPYYYSLHTPIPYAGTGNMDNMHSATFRLKNGMTLTTYGDYDSEGRRHTNPSAMPWQRNDFRGSLQLKSADGKFSFGVHVHRGSAPY